MTDYLIVGLGNPGPERADQRHNMGFRCINHLARRHGISLRAGRLASAGKGRIDSAEVVLAKPRTWMNNSGNAVGPLLRRERVPVENLTVVYDDLDLPEGRIRLRPGGGDGGHNGLKSIIAAIGSGDFGRVRIGIGRPLDRGVPTWDPDLVMRYVLARPPRASQEALQAAIERACDAIEAVIRNGWERAMDRYNRAEPQDAGKGSES